MPQYRYMGFADVLHKSEDDKGTKKGDVGTFTQKMVEELTAQGHRFIAEDTHKEVVVELPPVIGKDTVSTLVDEGKAK